MFGRWVALIVALALSGCASIPGPDEAASDTRKLFADYTAAFNARQWDRIIAMVSDGPGFQWNEDGKVAYASKAALAESYEWLRTNAVQAAFVPSDTNVTPHGADAAQIATRFAMTIATRDGRRIVYSGEMRIDVRREGPSWKVVSGETRSAR